MNRAILLCGIPGCGKSTHARKLYEEAIADGTEARIFSSDAIREELYGDESIVGDSKEVFRIMNERFIKYVEAHPNATAIYDATNLTVKTRKAWIAMLKKSSTVCHFECHFIACRISECKRRQFSRDRQVPEEVIERMVRQFQAPFYNEGWDTIRIIVGGKLYDLTEEHLNCWETSHDNPHHELTIGSHMATARREAIPLIDALGYGAAAIDAAYHHDIGKPHVKAFVNARGEPTSEAHYYSHESVSAYMYLSSDHGEENIDKVLTTASLIQWHMIPYFVTPRGEEPTREGLEEWQNKHHFRPEFINLLWVVHQADQEAH